LPKSSNDSFLAFNSLLPGEGNVIRTMRRSKANHHRQPAHSSEK
jgi:hypothetical protein